MTTVVTRSQALDLEHDRRRMRDTAVRLQLHGASDHQLREVSLIGL